MSTANMPVAKPVSKTYHPGWRGFQQMIFMFQMGVGLALLAMNTKLYFSTVADYQQCMASLPVGAIDSFCGRINSTNLYLLGMVMTGLMALMAAAGLILWITRMRLTLSPEGLEYDSGTHRTRARWEDVAGLIRYKRLWVVHEYLTLRNSEVETSPLLRWAVSGKARTLIPVSLFARNWRHNPLGDDIRRFAPQVFDRTAQG